MTLHPMYNVRTFLLLLQCAKLECLGRDVLSCACVLIFRPVVNSGAGRDHSHYVESSKG